MYRLLKFSLCLAVGATLSGAALAAPKVVASIKPVHSLAAQIMNGVATPDLLIEGAQSPHGASLRPSQARAIQRADLVIWVGHNLEGFLEKPLTTSTGNTKVLELMDLPGLKHLAAGEDHHHDDEGHEGEDEHHDEEAGHKGEEAGHDDEHDENEQDPHIWLNTFNAGVIATAIAAHLTEIDPANAATYQSNLQTTVTSLQSLDEKITARLEPFQDRGFILFHDAYRHFEARVGLQNVGTVRVNPEVPPSVEQIRTLKQTMATQNVQCLFSEPQYAPKVLKVVAEGTDARIHQLDPLGADIPAGLTLYSQLLEQLTASFYDCFSRS